MNDRRAPIRLAIPPGTPESHCIGPSCGKTIFFVPSDRIDLKTGRIKKIPVDSDGTPHWSTCRDSAMFRKNKGKEKGNAL
jgi:hypothetical protein